MDDTERKMRIRREELISRAVLRLQDLYNAEVDQSEEDVSQSECLDRAMKKMDGSFDAEILRAISQDENLFIVLESQYRFQF